VLLVGRALIGVARRDGDAVDAHRRHVSSKNLAMRFGVGAVEQGAVDAGCEALGLGQLDRGDGLVVDAVLADRLVVHGLVAVQVDDQVKYGCGLYWCIFFSAAARWCTG
jgi:hypothetical protein